MAYHAQGHRVTKPMQRFLLILLSLLSWPSLHAQVNEIGGTIGACYYIGDLNPTRHYPRDTKMAGGIVFRHNFNDRYALRLQGLYGTLQAYDSDSPDSLQQLRNLHFRSKLTEISLLLEINFFKYRLRGKDGRKWTPFVFGGLAYFHANPKAQLDDTWYDLQPLGTEGQGTSVGGNFYKVDQVCIPFGAGMKFNLGRVDVQVEWGLRRTYTDYIDDVSGTYVDNDLLAFENGPLSAQLADPSGLSDVPGPTQSGRARGDVNTRDWYQYTGVAITYIISRFSDCDEQYNWMKRKH
ncbi:MAG TPA: DUF6089 family protein [Flavobacteriales bacterium]|nr:DUF6089 family protein [Flavobacteriales bacterium]